MLLHAQDVLCNIIRTGFKIEHPYNPKNEAVTMTGNNVKLQANLLCYVPQIMFTQFAGEVYVICTDLVHILNSIWIFDIAEWG